MWNALISASFVFLIGLPGISGLPGLHGLGIKRAAPAAPPDSLPPRWKPASFLAVEDRIVMLRLPRLGPEGPSLKLTSDPRRLRVAYDADSGLVTATPELGGIALGEATQAPVRTYARDLTQFNLARLWSEKSIANVNSLGAATGTTATSDHGGISVKFPSPLPRKVQSLLGPGGPALNVSGSENISLSGQSNWSNQQVGLLGQRRSLFPSLDMQQNLDIRLEGQLSDRVKVNLLQSSTTQIPLANRIAINYRGEEDDLVQEFDLGNTNLSLPGTQYVSYSGKNEGLFGVKAATRLGPLDFTILASKQEGRSERASYAGGASKQTNSLADGDFVRGVYFFLYDPNVGSGYQALDIPDSSIRVYLDDRKFTTDINSIRGRALIHPESAVGDSTDTLSVRGSFRLLQPGADNGYDILRDVYGPNWKVIRLRQPVADEQRLAVTYVARPIGPTGPTGAYTPVGGEDVLDDDGVVTVRRLKLIRPGVDLLAVDPSGLYLDVGPYAALRDLELRNFYQLGGQRIDPKTFKLTIRRGTDDPPVTVEQTGEGPVPYIEVLGLDNFDETGGIPVRRKHDGVVDGTAPDINYRVFVDYENGVLFFFDPRPFAPRLGPTGAPFERFLSTLLFRRDSLVGTEDQPNAANPIVYESSRLQDIRLNAKYFMDVEFTASAVGNEIQLGRGNILEGSESVTINGVALKVDRDYTIDYDLGRLTLKRQIGPSDQLNVDYSYAPLFQQAGRTLVGSAFKLEGRDRLLGGAFLYESKGAQDLRPRLGEEPSRSLIGDLNGDWTFRPTWVTRMVDRLPGVRTTSPSEFRVQAEVGASFPNPNTRNEVFIDDMEGVRDAVTLSMGPERWRPSSVPSRKSGAIVSSMLSAYRMHDAEMHWFSPPSTVKERDLRPTLTQAQGGENSRQVLALSIPRRPTTAVNPDVDPAMYDSLFAGLTYPLDPVGLDISRAQFIELWVNDFHDEHVPGAPEPRVRGRHVRLHIDIGKVSEDEMRAPDQPPDGVLQSEDRPPRDNLLTSTTSNNEDTGYDGRVDPDQLKTPDDLPENPARVLDLVTASPTDPEGDDFRSTDDRFKEIDPRRYRFTNGTEGNKNLSPIPDTEDLNLNDNLDTQENYFEYTVDLGDTANTYLVTDVQAKYSGVPTDNGWRRYRIPLGDAGRVSFGFPTLTLAQHVRVWIEGVVNVDPDADSLNGNPQRPLLMLGALEIVGSRWQVTPLDAMSLADSTTVTLNSENTLDNAESYSPPFDPGKTVSGSQEVSRREQSLALEFTGFRASDTLEAFKTFSIDEDYTRYGSLDWFAAGFQVPGYTAGVDSLDYFVRFASDETGRNYYEYRAHLPPSSIPGDIHWNEVRLKLTDLSNLKLNLNFPKVDPILYQVAGPSPGEIYTIRGRPSFTRVRRVSFGLINAHIDSTRVFPSGQLWFDELRATDVARDAGRAQRVLLTGRFSNLLSYNMTWNGRDANFLSVGESRGSGTSSDQVNLGTTMDVHRFFQGTGIVLPVTYTYGRNSARPRFTAGDDVTRTGFLAEASETRSENQSWSTSYSRSWSERSNPLLRLTLGGITASIQRSEYKSRSPNMVSNGTGVTAGVNYGISPRNLLIVRMPGMKAKLYPLPERVYWNYAVSTRVDSVYDRLRDSTGTLVLRSATRGRTGFINFGGDMRPVDLAHYHVEGVRNLTLGEGLSQHWGFVNLGRVVNWRQNMDAHYAFSRGNWLKPSLNWASSYNQNNGPELSPDLHLRAIANNQTMSMTWAFPFDRWARPSVAAPAPPPRVTQPADSTGARPAVPDSAVRVRPQRQWSFRGLLSHFGTIGTEAGLGSSSSYSRVSGQPDFFYLTGLKSDPGVASDGTGRLLAEFGNQSLRARDWHTSARTRVALVKGAAINTVAELSTRRINQNDVISRTVNTRYPDFDFDYGTLPSLIRLDRLLRDIQVRTAYGRSTQKEYRDGSDPISVTTGDQWQPMLSLSGSLKNGTKAVFKVERRTSKREDLTLGRSITTDRNTDVNFSLNRSYTQGQKVTVLGKEKTVRSTINLGMSAAYSKRSGETKREGEIRPVLPRDEDRLSVNTNGSYGFSTNVTGNVALGFGQTRNLTRGTVQRNVRVELRAAFTF